jgi:hypothetical protein
LRGSVAEEAIQFNFLLDCFPNARKDEKRKAQRRKKENAKTKKNKAQRQKRKKFKKIFQKITIYFAR